MKHDFLILAVFFFIIFCITLIVPPVTAYPRVPQGGSVFLNDTVDISGVAAGYLYLAYIDEYSTDLSAANWTITVMIDLPETKEGYYNYSISDFFSDKLGYWYRYNGIYESNANNRAFKVKAKRDENFTRNVSEEREEVEVPVIPPILPERVVSDYLIARGDQLNVTYNWSKATVWIFGRVNGIYDRKVINGTAKFNSSETSRLEAGSYQMMYYSAGTDKKFDMRISKDTLEYFDSEMFKVRSVDLKPLSPMVVLDRIKWIAGVNDDNFTLYELEVQNPMIDITAVDSIIVDAFNQTGVIQVRGYTNLANETPISFVLDEDKTPEELLGHKRMQNRWNSTVLAVQNPGSMRYFDYGIPIFFGQMYPGQHTITAYSSYNTKSNVDFWIYDLPEGSQPRNKTVRYVGGYEFVPTPTPEIVVQEKIVQAPPIIKEVIKEVGPTDAQVRAQQEEVAKGYAILAVAGGVLLLLVLLGAKYLYGAWKRSRLE